MLNKDIKDRPLNNTRSFSVWRSVGRSLGYFENGIRLLAVGKRNVLRFLTGRVKIIPSHPKLPQKGSYSPHISRPNPIKKDMEGLYLALGRACSIFPDREGISENKEISGILKEISETEKESNSLRKSLEISENSEYISVFKARENKRQQLNVSTHSILNSTQFSSEPEAVLFRKAVANLLNDKLDVKCLGASQLGIIRNQAANPILKEALALNDHSLEAEIISSLIHLADKDILRICKHYSQSDGSEVKRACVRGLYKFSGRDSIPYLINYLSDKDTEVRNYAATFLGWLEAKEAVKYLLDAAKDPDKRVRKSVIISLAIIRNRATILPLIRLIDDNEKEIRQKIIDVIPKISGRKIPQAYRVNQSTKAERQKQIEQLKEWWVRTSVDSIN